MGQTEEPARKCQALRGNKEGVLYNQRRIRGDVPMKVALVSDTHTHEPMIPDGVDLILHAGDFSSWGTRKEYLLFREWIISTGVPTVHIAGNHERYLERNRPHPNPCIEYLQDQETTVQGIKIYGSPWQPRFFDWAFNLDHEGLVEVWGKIPDDTEILITHGPPYGILDLTPRGEYVGCTALRDRVEQLEHLKLHLFGHIHYSYGVDKIDGVTYVNASVCDERYRNANPIRVVEITKEDGDVQILFVDS